MVNHLDMWDKGAKMLQVGVSRQFIGHSLAIELAIDPVQRQFQLDANQALIQQADGGLAPMTGQERFLTIYEVLMCFYHCFCFSNLASPRLFDFVQQPHHCLSPSNPTWMPTKAGIPRGKLGH
jgi:hypothetical protein